MTSVTPAAAEGTGQAWTPVNREYGKSIPGSFFDLEYWELVREQEQQHGT